MTDISAASQAARREKRPSAVLRPEIASPAPPVDEARAASEAEAVPRKRRFVHVSRAALARIEHFTPQQRWERVSSGQWHFRNQVVVGDNYRHLVANNCTVRGNNNAVFGDDNKIYGDNITVTGNKNCVYGRNATLVGNDNVAFDEAPAAPPPPAPVEPEIPVVEAPPPSEPVAEVEVPAESDPFEFRDDDEEEEVEVQEETPALVARLLRTTGNMLLDSYLRQQAQQPENQEFFLRYNIIGSEVIQPAAAPQPARRQSRRAAAPPVGAIDAQVQNALMPQAGQDPRDNKWKVSLLDIEGESKSGPPGFQCSICLEAEPDVAFEPCGHITCCRKCTRSLHAEGSKCPQCRVVVQFARIMYY